MHNVSDVRKNEAHIVKPLVPHSSHVEVEIATAKLKKYKLPGGDQLLPELIQGGGETLLSGIHELIHSVWLKEKFPDQWKMCAIVPI